MVPTTTTPTSSADTINKIVAPSSSTANALLNKIARLEIEPGDEVAKITRRNS